jgi:hypothetical protein
MAQSVFRLRASSQNPFKVGRQYIPLNLTNWSMNQNSHSNCEYVTFFLDWPTFFSSVYAYLHPPRLRVTQSTEFHKEHTPKHTSNSYSYMPYTVSHQG